MAKLVLPHADGKAAATYVFSPSGFSTPCLAREPSFRSTQREKKDLCKEREMPRDSKRARGAVRGTRGDVKGRAVMGERETTEVEEREEWQTQNDNAAGRG